VRRGAGGERPRRMSSAEVVASLGLAAGAETEQWRVAPASVAWNAVLIDTAEVFVYVPALRVYSSGFRFTLTALLRPTASEQAARDFADGGAVGRMHAPEAEDQVLRGLRVGVRFADGGRAVLDRNRMRPAARTTPQSLPVIGSNRWTSDDGIFEWGINVVGIPQEGPVELYYQWLALGVAEAFVLVDGDAVRSASERVVEIWPREPR
jgi:hypothetical protein